MTGAQEKVLLTPGTESNAVGKFLIRHLHAGLEARGS